MNFFFLFVKKEGKQNNYSYSQIIILFWLNVHNMWLNIKELLKKIQDLHL